MDMHLVYLSLCSEIGKESKDCVFLIYRPNFGGSFRVYPKFLALDFLSNFGGKKFCEYVGHLEEKSLFTD